MKMSPPTSRSPEFYTVLCAITAIGCLLGSLSAHADIRYVDIDAASGGDGLSWQTAFREIQPAVDAAFAAGGGEVWVAEGIYSEQRDPEDGSLKMRDGVYLYGGFDGSETVREMADPEAHVTTIDGSHGIAGSPAWYTVQSAAQCMLKGFVLNGAQYRNIYIYQCEEAILDSNIVLNRGIFIADTPNVIIRNSKIYNCSSDMDGAGIYSARTQNVEITNCDISNNATNVFTIWSRCGGGISISADTLTLKDCIFKGNESTTGGGADIIGVNKSMEMINCVFEDNKAKWGAGLNLMTEKTKITDCLFRGNIASESGGGISFGSDYYKYYPIRIERCLFEENSAAYGGGIDYMGLGYNSPVFEIMFEWLPVVANCVFRGNVATADRGNALYARHFACCWVFPDIKQAYPSRTSFTHDLLGNIGTELPDRAGLEKFFDIKGKMNATGNAVERSRMDQSSSKEVDLPSYWPLMIVNCSFVQNGTSAASSTVHADSNYESLYMYNCLFWDNASTEDLGDSGEIYGDNGNGYVDPTGLDPCELNYGEMAGCLFNVDPKFVNEASGDYRLQSGSPCIDAGVDTSTIRYGSVLDDFLGRARGFDGDFNGLNGAGDIDIGAYEFSGEGCGVWPPHSADINCDGHLTLTELLRVIQLFNLRGYACAASEDTTEDGYLPGPGLEHFCMPHASDYNPQDWTINLSELLRTVQFFNSRAYHPCLGAGTEDDYCPGSE